MLFYQILTVFLPLFYIFLAIYDILKKEVPDLAILNILFLIGLLGILQGNLGFRLFCVVIVGLLLSFVDPLGGGDWKLLTVTTGLFLNLWLVLGFVWLFFLSYTLFTLVSEKVFEKRSERLPLVPFITLAYLTILFF